MIEKDNHEADGEAVLSVEPINRSQYDALLRMTTPIQQQIARLGDADLTRGRGVLPGKHRRCLWTHDGCRITIAPIMGGGLIISVAKEPDPKAPYSTL